MSYETAGRLILIKLARAVIWDGVKDRNHPDHVKALRSLQTAVDMEVEHLPRPKAETAQRYALRNAEAILAPYIARNIEAARFGLALVYVIQELANQGLHEPNSAFQEVLEDGLMHEEGTIVEWHKDDEASASSVTMGLEIMTSLNTLGYFTQEKAA